MNKSSPVIFFFLLQYIHTQLAIKRYLFFYGTRTLYQIICFLFRSFKRKANKYEFVLVVIIRRNEGQIREQLLLCYFPIMYLLKSHWFLNFFTRNFHSCWLFAWFIFALPGQSYLMILFEKSHFQHPFCCCCCSITRSMKSNRCTWASISLTQLKLVSMNMWILRTIFRKKLLKVSTFWLCTLSNTCELPWRFMLKDGQTGYNHYPTFFY